MCAVAHPSASRPTPLCTSPHACLCIPTLVCTLPHAPQRVVARLAPCPLCIVTCRLCIAHAPLHIVLGCDMLLSHAPPARGRDCNTHIVWARVNVHSCLGQGMHTRIWGEGEHVLAFGARVKPHVLTFGVRARACTAVRVPPSARRLGTRHPPQGYGYSKGLRNRTLTRTRRYPWAKPPGFLKPVPDPR
jgi:hypothetical protein